MNIRLVNFLSTTLHYDYKGNIVGKHNQNILSGYDNLGRLKQATYSGSGNRNYSTSYTYDKHGNLCAISRYEQRISEASYAYVLINHLSVTITIAYDGNRLVNASEAVANQSNFGLMEFKRQSFSSSHYTYDVNDNLTKDLHKNISSIHYNYLHLPNQVTFADGKTVTYVHDASGVKHEVTHYIRH